MPAIRFYLPDGIPDDMPLSPGEYWTGFVGRMRSGVYAWIVQTYQHLRAAGFPCELTSTLPRDGIMIAHRKSLPRDYVPPPGLLFVCTRADATFHPYAHWHVVLNRRQLTPWFPAVYMPHWPQPGLLPRDPARGATWANAAYFGAPECFADEMQDASWGQTLRDLQLQWRFVSPDKWHDFRDVDVVVAVRSFDGHRHENKPPTKLFNAWHAGVPAVLGRETAYQQQRKSTLDYLEVHSFSEVVAALHRLKDDPALRRKMAANGAERAKESDPSIITARWREFLESTAIPSYESLRKAGDWQQRFFRGMGVLKTAGQDLRQRFWR
jgi:hypothetical protein